MDGDAISEVVRAGPYNAADTLVDWSRIDGTRYVIKLVISNSQTCRRTATSLCATNDVFIAEMLGTA